MPSDSLLTLISFILITSFSPGPANIASASMGILYGYRTTLKFLLGLAIGAFIMILFSGLISSAILTTLPALEPALRIIGAAYILYLAFHIFRASYSFDQTDQQPMGAVQGILLQALNPKLIVYGLTLFSAFLAPFAGNVAILVLAATMQALTAFCATSTWTLFGTVIKRYAHHPRRTRIVNSALALLLVYTALDLVGII